jgi:hypothetical protein
MPQHTTNGRRTESAAAVRRTLRERLTGWLVADDPTPDYSRLDRMDGLVR